MKACGTVSRLSSAREILELLCSPRSRMQNRHRSSHRELRMLHLAFRANRENFLAAQRELEKRGIEFEFQDHEISHSIYFRDPDGHQLEITTYELPS